MQDQITGLTYGLGRRHWLSSASCEVSYCDACVVATELGTRRLCSLFYLLCYVALLKILPIMLKLMLNIYLLCSNYAQYLYLSSHVFLVNLHFMGKQ